MQQTGRQLFLKSDFAVVRRRVRSAKVSTFSSTKPTQMRILALNILYVTLILEFKRYMSVLRRHYLAKQLFLHEARGQLSAIFFFTEAHKA